MGSVFRATYRAIDAPGCVVASYTNKQVLVE